MKSPPGPPPPLGPPPRGPPEDPPPPGIWLAVEPRPSEPVEADVVERRDAVAARGVAALAVVRPEPPLRSPLPAAPADDETVSPETLDPPPPEPPPAPEVDATMLPPDIEVAANVDWPPLEVLPPRDPPPPRSPPPPDDETITVIPPPRPPPIIEIDPPLRPPRIDGAINETYFSAAVVPVSLSVFSIGAAAAVAVRIVTNDAVLVASAFDCHIQYPAPAATHAIRAIPMPANDLFGGSSFGAMACGPAGAPLGCGNGRFGKAEPDM
jgi:hypothetical protein